MGNALDREIARHRRASQVDLGRRGLRTLPESVAQLRAVERLSVAGNTLVSLPAAVGALKRLQALDVSDNNITTLPGELCELTQLRELNASSWHGGRRDGATEAHAPRAGNNRLFYAPLQPRLVELNSLVRLNLAGNQLESVNRLALAPPR